MNDATVSLRYLGRSRPDGTEGPDVRTLVGPEPVRRDDGWVLRGLDERSGAQVEVAMGEVVDWLAPHPARGSEATGSESAGAEAAGAEAAGSEVAGSEAGGSAPTVSTAERTPLVPGVYRHYKGRYYWLLDVARHSETEEELAVYRCLYGDFSLWVRPLGMFTEQVRVEGVAQPRFAYLGPVAGGALA